MKKLLIVFPILLIACGQPEDLKTGKVNFAYSRPSSLGLYDPKATPAGTFYRWNMETNRLTLLDEAVLSPKTKTAPRTLTSSRLSAFGVEGLPLSSVTLVEAQIGGEFKTEVKDSVRQNFSGSRTALTNYVKGEKQSGQSTEDILNTFKPRDQRFRVVIFVSEESSSSTTFRVGSLEGQDNSVANFEVNLPGQQVVKVTADAKSEASCEKPNGGQGDRPVCFTDVIVYDPVVRPNGNIDWEIDDGYDRSALSDALRKL